MHVSSKSKQILDTITLETRTIPNSFTVDIAANREGITAKKLIKHAVPIRSARSSVGALIKPNINTQLNLTLRSYKLTSTTEQWLTRDKMNEANESYIGWDWSSVESFKASSKILFATCRSTNQIALLRNTNSIQFKQVLFVWCMYTSTVLYSSFHRSKLVHASDMIVKYRQPFCLQDERKWVSYNGLCTTLLQKSGFVAGSI